MFKKLLCLISICSLGFLAPASQAADETAAVNAAVEQLRVLMVTPDKAALEAIVADDLSYGHSAGKIDTKASFINDLLTGASDFVSIELSDQTVRVSGNVAFPASVDVVVQDNTRTNMEKMPIFKEHNNAGMAKRTFKDKMTIGTGADQIDLYYFGRGHTNGDAWIVFPAHRIVHSGDIFSGKNVPLIDTSNGGSMVQIAETLKKAHEGIKNVEQIINGHTPAQTTWADLKEYYEFNQDLVAWMRAGLKAGKTPEQLAAEWKVPEKYKGYSPTVSALMGGMVGRIQALQKEIQ